MAWSPKPCYLCGLVCPSCLTHYIALTLAFIPSEMPHFSHLRAFAQVAPSSAPTTSLSSLLNPTHPSGLSLKSTAEHPQVEVLRVCLGVFVRVFVFCICVHCIFLCQTFHTCNDLFHLFIHQLAQSTCWCQALL